MQSNNAGQRADSDANQEGGVITALIDSATQILQRYSIQWRTSKEMAYLEWTITRKCLWFAAVVLIVFGGVVLSACIALAVVLAYSLYTLGVPVWLIALALIGAHGVALWVLARMLRGLIKRMGFARTMAIVQAPKMAQSCVRNASEQGDS